MMNNKKMKFNPIKKASMKKLGLAIKVAGVCSLLSLPYSFAEQSMPAISPSSPTNAVADEASKKALLALLKKTNFFSANFSQKVFDEAGNMLQEGRGKLAVKKPNLVKWHTTSPDELTIVSDGKNIWFYDPFIEQATVYGFDSALANTPVLLLTSDEPTLWDKFNVARVMSTDKKKPFVSFSIQSKDHNSQVKRLVLSFTPETKSNSAKLAQFTFEDATGQLSVIDLLDFDQQQAPAKTLFEFSLPQGVNLDDQR